MYTYTGEIIKVEEGVEETYAANLEQVLRMVRNLQVGDALVINRTE